MSWHFSRALVADYSQARSLDGEPCVPSNETLWPSRFLSRVRTTEVLSLSRSGTTWTTLTDARGEALSMWCQAGSHASRSLRRLEDELSREIDGPTCFALSVRSSRVPYAPRTSPMLLLIEPQPICEPSDIQLPSVCSAPVASAVPPGVHAGGWFPTPTAKANHDAPSMRKWPAYALWQNWTGGRTTPVLWEWLMGWPIGWTDSQRSATDKFQQWLHAHSSAFNIS